jgi:hypothetical protein
MQKKCPLCDKYHITKASEYYDIDEIDSIYGIESEGYYIAKTGKYETFIEYSYGLKSKIEFVVKE